MTALAILVTIELALLSAVVLVVGRRPAPVALFLIVLAAPLEVYRSSAGGFNVSLFRLSLLVGVGVAVVELVRWRTVPRVDWRVVATVAGLLAVVAAAFAWHPINSFLASRQMLTLAVAIAAVATIGTLWRNDVPVAHVGMAIVASCALPILASAWQALAPRIGADPTLPLVTHLETAEGLSVNISAPAAVGALSVRTKGTFADPNHCGVYLMIAFLVALALTAATLRSQDAARRLTAVAATGAIGLTLLSTYSRTAWLGCSVALVMAAVLAWPHLRDRLRRPTHRTGLMLALSALAIALAAIPVVPNVVERLNPSAPINVGSNATHESTLRAAAEEFQTNPVLGAGPGALGARLSQGKRTSAAHSTYMTAAGELGLAGVLMVVATGVVVLLRLLAGRRRGSWTDRLIAGALAAAYAGFLAANLTYDLWFDDFHWVLVGVAGALALRLGDETQMVAPRAPPECDLAVSS
jgi:hypothetical protein